MNNEEQYIRERVGQKNPFRVPDGYFDTLADRIMSQLPEQPAAIVHVEAPKQKSRFVALRPWIFSAAASILAVVMVTSLYFRPSAGEQTLAATTVESSYMDEAADYVMLDNAEIYACLADY